MTEPTRDALHALAHELVTQDVTCSRQATRDLARGYLALEAEVERLRGLLGELVDTGDCRYDHHGYCQAHKLDPRPCPNERAATLLAAYAAATREGTDA